MNTNRRQHSITCTCPTCTAVLVPTYTLADLEAEEARIAAEQADYDEWCRDWAADHLCPRCEMHYRLCECPEVLEAREVEAIELAEWLASIA